MSRWRIAALIAVATLVPALTAAVVLADLAEASREALLAAAAEQAVVLGAGLLVLVGLVGGIGWTAWRSERRRDQRTAAAVAVIARTNPGHRLPGDTELERAVNDLAERHHSAEERLAAQLAAAHEELRRERDALLAVLAGLDVPVGVVDERGRVLLVNPAARREFGTRWPLAAGRSVFSVFDAEDFIPLLQAALAGDRVTAAVAGRLIRLIRITGPESPVMVLILGAGGQSGAAAPAGTVAAGERPVVGLSFDLARPSRPTPARAEWPETPLADLVFTVLDCETTGLHVAAGDRLVALAGVRVDGGVVRADDTFDALVNPGRAIPELSTSFHGITDDLVAQAPAPGVVVKEFAAYAADSVLVGHQLDFDLGFLAPVAVDEGVRLEPLTLDTMLLSAVLDPDPETRHGLDSVCQRMGVDVVGRHTALGDALATAEVLVRMIPMLSERGITTLGQARRAAAETEVAKRLRTAVPAGDQQGMGRADRR